MDAVRSVELSTQRPQVIQFAIYDVVDFLCMLALPCGLSKTL
jgi:hypothetical protein